MVQPTRCTGLPVSYTHAGGLDDAGKEVGQAFQPDLRPNPTEPTEPTRRQAESPTDEFPAGRGLAMSAGASR